MAELSAADETSDSYWDLLACVAPGRARGARERPDGALTRIGTVPPCSQAARTAGKESGGRSRVAHRCGREPVRHRLVSLLIRRWRNRSTICFMTLDAVDRENA